MSSCLNRFLRTRCGSAAIEFALIVPFVLLVMTAVIDYGRALSHRNTVEKGVRAGAMLAARSDDPMTADQLVSVQNMVKTGTIDGSADFLVSGWSEAGATVTITSTNFSGSGVTNLAVIEVAASVPYVALLPGLAGFFGLNDITITVSHEQAHIGS